MKLSPDAISMTHLIKNRTFFQEEIALKHTGKIFSCPLILFLFSLADVTFWLSIVSVEKD
jgi:hypothetical protein